MRISQTVGTMAALLAAMMVASSCSKEQTSMTVDDIQGRARIIGSLTYNEGQSYENGAYSELIKPAAGKSVYVKVSNNSLDPNSAASGYTTYVATTDADGRYDINIPVVDKDGGTKVIIMPEAFTGTRTLLTTIQDGEPVFEEKEVVFELQQEDLSLSSRETVVKDLTYGFTERDIEKGFPVTVPLKVKVGLGISERSDYSYSLQGAFDFEAGKAVMISVTYDNVQDGGQAMVRNYAGTTDSRGEVVFNIPAQSKQWEDVNIAIKAMPFTVSSFTYYDYSNDRYTIDGGVYQQYSNYSLNTAQNTDVDFMGLEGVTDIREVRMVFTPFSGVEDYGYDYSNYNWGSYPFE